jgi:AbrB family transcriptional regulator (stage V sporulation protein T)
MILSLPEHFGGIRKDDAADKLRPVNEKQKGVIMRATGIVRRIDDLGRVVVPKEIRRTLRIREGEPLEIYTNKEGGIVLKKYSPVGELGELAGEYVEAVAQVAKCTACVADRDRIVAAAGSHKKDFMGKELHADMILCIRDRKNIVAEKNSTAFRQITTEMPPVLSEAVTTIVSDGDAIGAVLLLGFDPARQFGEFEEKMAMCGADFMRRQLD